VPNNAERKRSFIELVAPWNSKEECNREISRASKKGPDDRSLRTLVEPRGGETPRCAVPLKRRTLLHAVQVCGHAGLLVRRVVAVQNALGDGLVVQTSSNAHLLLGCILVAGLHECVELAGLGAQTGADCLVVLTCDLVGEHALLGLLDVCHVLATSSLKISVRENHGGRVCPTTFSHTMPKVLRRAVGGPDPPWGTRGILAAAWRETSPRRR